MASSDADIANLALRHLALSTIIGSLTENSKAAKACNDFYAQTRDEVLEAFAWPFCTKLDNLALVATAPNVEWAYSYQYPDCVAFRRISSGTRIDTRQTRIPYRIAQGASGKVIFTDLVSAQGEWTVRVTDPTQFSPSFTQAVALKLASYVGPTIGSELATKLADRAGAKYEAQIGIALANAFNEQQADEDPDAEHIRARDGVIFPNTIFNQAL